jgi:hypothetical protein
MIIKIKNDTLKEKGKYSRKSLTVLVTFLFILALGTFIVISDKIVEKEVNRYAIYVFNSLLVFLTLLMGLTEAEIKLALLGNPLSGEKGLAGRVDFLNEKVELQENQIKLLIEEKTRNSVYVMLIKWLLTVIGVGVIGLIFNYFNNK